MLKTRNFIRMDVRLLPATEGDKASFPVKKAVLVGLLLCLAIAIGVFCIKRRTPGTEKETFIEFHSPNPKPKVQICGNVDRVSIAKENCDNVAAKNQTTLSRSHYKHILVDDKHKVLYCAIPGTGYGSIKRLLAYHSGRINAATPPYPAGDDTKFLSNLGLRYLNTFKSNAIKLKLKHYYKFVLVRHPFVRLKSAFSLMFVSSKVGIEKYQGAIETFYDKAKLTYVDGRPTISFYQFLQLIIGSKEFRDEHWRSYYGMCHPCDIRYDAIIKLETIQNDIQSIMDHLAGGTDNKSSASLYEVFWNIHDFDKYKMTNAIFRSVPSKLLKQLLKYYEKDLNIFGYSWDNNTGLHCSANHTTAYDCC